MKIDNSPIHVILVVLVITFFIWLGFGEQRKEVSSCTGVYSKKIVAVFEKDVVTTCYDSFLEAWVPCTETEVWREDASPEYTVYTLNGKVKTKYPYTMMNGLGVPDWPKRNIDYHNNRYFKRYVNTQASYYETVFTDGDHVKDSIDVHKQCMRYIGEGIPIKTWYGITYSIDT